MSSFGISARIFFGPQRHEELHAFLQPRDLRSVLPVVDASIEASLVIAGILDDFRRRGYEVRSPAVIAIRGEPTYAQLDDHAALVREGSPDLILAFGGGSVIDLAKGMAVLATNPGRGIDYRGMHKVRKASVPLVACPSTAGTGTEVTWTASFIDKKDQKKLGINGDNIAPLCGLLEPELAASCPAAVALGAGLDTMVHAIEAVSARTATSLTATLGARAFAMMYEALPRCMANPASLDAWALAQLAATTAGIAMMNAGGGPASGISYPLGVHYGVPHGLAGGIFLAGVLGFNVEKGYLGYAQVYDALPDSDPGLDPVGKSIDFVRKFCNFYDRLNAPRDLRRWNCVGREAVTRLADLTLEQRKENLDLNPVPFGRGEVVDLLSGICL